MLQFFSKRYIVIIAARDTPCGPDYTEAVSAEVMKMGLKIDLCNKFRYGYAAIINAGVIELEKISPTSTEWIEDKFYIEDISVEVVSVGFNAPKPSTALIVINGENYSPCQRGLNFVVFDKETKTVVDAVNFDTFNNNFPCQRPSDLVNGLLHYKKMHPDVSLLCFNSPGCPSTNLSENEKFILENDIVRGTILNNLDKPVFALNKYFSDVEDIVKF